MSVRIGNTGVNAACENLFRAPAGFLLVPKRADDGDLNQLLLSSDWDTAFFAALTQNADHSKRWRPVHNVKNATSERADPITQTYDDQSVFWIQDGARTNTLIIPNQGPVFYGKLKESKCREMCYMPYDSEGKLMGEVSADGLYLRPIEIASGTWNAILKMATDTTLNEVPINFQISKNVDDSLLKVVLPSEMNDIEISELVGLFDVNAVYTSALAAGFTMTLTTDYGTAKTPEPVTGLVLADFTFTEISPTPGSITANVASVTESALGSGIYAVVFTLPATAGDVIHVDINYSQNYDTELMGNVTLA